MTSKTQQNKNNRKYTLGYLPRVLFFNVFQLGAENMHISSIIKWRIIKVNARSLLNKEFYAIYSSFRRPSLSTFSSTTFIKWIFRNNPIKILFICFMHPCKFERYWYIDFLRFNFSNLIKYTQNIYA